MLTSALVLITILPLQVSPGGKNIIPFNRPLAISAFVDSAKILGLPKFKLRNSRGALYLADRIMQQEPLGIVHCSAGFTFPGEVGNRKAYIQVYIQR